MTPGPPLRWIPPLELSGPWQMAIDAWLLDRAVGRGHDQGAPERAGAMLRFYTWSRPTLSLGFHQRHLEPHWLELRRRGELALVRRPSGGRAVLHGGDLTYALVWPHAPARRREAYRLACAWLREGFAGLGMPLRFGMHSDGSRHPSCFATSTAADLVQADGGKRIGSAQLWRRGVLLQHGSIQVAPDGALWRHVLAEEPPPLRPLPWSATELIERLREAAGRHLPIAAGGWERGDLSPAEWSAIGGGLNRYQLPDPQPAEC